MPWLTVGINLEDLANVELVGLCNRPSPHFFSNEKCIRAIYFRESCSVWEREWSQFIFVMCCTNICWECNSSMLFHLLRAIHVGFQIFQIVGVIGTGVLKKQKQKSASKSLRKMNNNNREILEILYI